MCVRSVLRLANAVLWAAAVSGAAGAETPLEEGSGPVPAGLDEAAARVVLPERCGECHSAEFGVWRTTSHATGFDTLHRTERARGIARNLDLRLLRRTAGGVTPACLSCHYTPVPSRDGLRAGGGVSCESCHGPAREWITIHSDYGIPEADFQQAARLETAVHREKRIADSASAGMRRSRDLYTLASTCFACHTVPNEELVNRGGHSPGGDFELVAGNEGIRHNFLDSYRTGDGRTNAERSRADKRRLYVVGRALAVEYALRGLAAAAEDGFYATAMRDRFDAAVDELFAIEERVAIPLVQSIIAVSEAVEPKVGGGALSAAADAVGEATRTFLADSGGEALGAPGALAALDPLWDPELRETISVTAAAAPAADPLPPPEVPGSDDPEPDRSATEPEGDIRTPAAPTPAAVPDALLPARASRPAWRDPPAHDFVGVPCGRCHAQQLRWWRSDPHSQAADPLRQDLAGAIAIARAYGIAENDVARGTETCMWCHGTIVSNPARRVRAGVGCQACHGPGADYLKVHEVAGYRESLALGLTDLRDPKTQAATCAGCHYLTDPGLIDAGHPSGAGFDIVAAKVRMVHWGSGFGRETVPVATAALRSAFSGVLASRGPVPERRAGAAPPVDGPPPSGASSPPAAEPPPAAGETAPPPGAPAAEAEPTPGESMLETLREQLEELFRALGLRREKEPED